MSADNFNLVKRVDNRYGSPNQWRVWLNLSASGDRESQITREPDGLFDNEAEAVSWANAQGYTEYGTDVDVDSYEAVSRRRAKFAIKLAAAALLVREVAEEMRAHEAEHSETMFDDLRQFADKLEDGERLMKTEDEWSWG